ncbi:hypothetical protein VCS12_13910 [Vibrio cholerae]|nr:hypothetical protein VCS12_13910 [Vibrio cholerae]
MRLCLFLIALLISSNSKANDKVRCDTLTNSPYDFYGKGSIFGARVVFRYIQYDERYLTIYFESSSGASEYYSSYEFYFLPFQNDFLLKKVIKTYNVEVSDGFDLAKK